MNSKPCLMNLTSKFIININSFGSNLKILIMKKLLLIQFLLICVMGMAQTPIYQFNFQTPSATIGTGTFNFTSSGNPMASLNQDTDRSRVLGKAVSMPYFEAQANLSGLPLGASARTISCWVYHRSNENFTAFSYGNAAAGQAFGLSVMPGSGQIGFYGYGGLAYDKLVSHATVLNVWTHYAVTYDGAVVKIYVNGQLKLNTNVSLNTANSNFKIGINVANNYETANVKYDALNIFNIALTDTQIATLFRQNDSQTVLQSNIPTNGLVYANHFTNGNISDSSTTGAVAKTIAGTNAADSFGQSSNALSFDVGQFMDYEVVNYPEMYVGNNSTSNFEFSVSVQAKIDPTYYANLATGQYVVLINHGGIYLRILKSPSGSLLQGGYLQTNGVYANAPSISLSESLFTTNFLTAILTKAPSVPGMNMYANTFSSYIGGSPLGAEYSSFPKLVLGYQTNASNSFKGVIDNVYIYNRKLTETEVTTIVNSNTLSNLSFQTNNLKFKLYPNPVNDVVNIAIESELKTVEIYTLQGQKVMTTNQKEVNVSQLNTGIYLVKIEDENGAIATQKIIKN